MKNILFYSFIIFTLFSCKDHIKNSEDVVDEIQNTSENLENKILNSNTIIIKEKEDLVGFWVGWFEADLDENSYKKHIYIDEGLYWGRENKINISIDKIENNIVSGHSVVAGNKRPFQGNLAENETSFTVYLKEPGDDKYDGEFNFIVKKNDSLLDGTWKSYKKIDISNRKYNLTKKIFKYNPNQNLEFSKLYADWDKFIEKKEKIEIDNEVEEEIYRDFATNTDIVYKINASIKLLTKKELENLKKGDLLIIRNTIYARHGYSFKNRPLRIFYDAQPWYIPVFIDIKSKLTNIEKENIKLLLLYEKNAVEYYDRFGRG